MMTTISVLGALGSVCKASSRRKYSAATVAAVTGGGSSSGIDVAAVEAALDFGEFVMDDVRRNEGFGGVTALEGLSR